MPAEDINIDTLNLNTSAAKKPMKVVWICHFSNKEMLSILPVWNKVNEFAPWIPNTIKGFEHRDDIELHIISPHNYLKEITEFKLRGVYYHFIPFGIPFIHRHWPHQFRLDVYSRFRILRRKVKKIVEQINPDIINLMGAENSYYSSSILDLKSDYPVLVLIQGFIREFVDEPKKTAELKNRIAVEDEILRSFKYYCGEKDSSVIISKINPEHNFFRLFFPVNEDFVANTKVDGKKYDCIYFGRLEESKGAADFIRVVSELKTWNKDIKGCLIGSGNIHPYKELARKLDCDENIHFAGFIESQKELFEYVKSSRVFLAPPYKDRLSSTIREAMLLKVPIVAYATGGIPYINEFDENILLVKTGDYKEMARKTYSLLTDDNKAAALAEKAYKYCVDEFSLEVNVKRLMETYYTILSREGVLSEF